MKDAFDGFPVAVIVIVVVWFAIVASAIGGAGWLIWYAIEKFSAS